MVKTFKYIVFTFFSFVFFTAGGNPAGIHELLPVIKREIKGDRALGYVRRIWQYDKWSTLPMWKKSALEARMILKERGLDEAELVNTPADGVTRYGTWTNPIGWDCKQASLVVTEPYDIPGEYRFLCNYRYNPSSLTFFSCPTPPGGIEAELVVLEKSDPEALSGLNARGKIILVSSGAGRLKRYLDRNGVLGIVSDQEIDEHPEANAWLNTWSDFPGGWLMTATDSMNSFCFSISKKKGDYLRTLIGQGKTVKVRVTIDSRYFTDDSLPYVTGCIKGAGSEGEEVLIGGHLFEWGANDNATGCAVMLETVGTLNDLIKSGALPRPKRSIRIWMGQELYGSLAFAEHNIDRLRKTLAAVCCDTPAPAYDLLSSTVKVYMNCNVCPTFTDAVYPEIFRRYYESIRSNKVLIIEAFIGGTDTYFCEPMIGVPTNFVYMENGSPLHHCSLDTIDKVDSRSLRDLCISNALYLYYLANAGYDDIPFIAGLTFERGAKVILDKTAAMKTRLNDAHDGVTLGKVRSEGIKTIRYYTDLQKEALKSIGRIVSPDEKTHASEMLSRYINDIDELGMLMVRQFTEAVKEKSKTESIKIIAYKKTAGSWEREAEKIVPKRRYFGTLTLEGIPVEEWKEVTSSPRWWSPRAWAAASYWWCDGKRNLNEIKELLELEAGVPVQNFDLITYYTFLKKYNIVEFVQ